MLVAGSQIVQHAKQSQPGGDNLAQVAMHFGDSARVPIGGGHALGSYLLRPRSAGQSLTVFAPSRQHTWMLQPSLPAPLSPSKKQSCSTGSLLSPGIPVPNDDSSLSLGPVHCRSDAVDLAVVVVVLAVRALRPAGGAHPRERRRIDGAAVPGATAAAVRVPAAVAVVAARHQHRDRKTHPEPCGHGRSPLSGPSGLARRYGLVARACRSSAGTAAAGRRRRSPRPGSAGGRCRARSRRGDRGD